MLRHSYSAWYYAWSAMYFTIYGVLKYIPSPIGDCLRSMCLRMFVHRINTLWIKEGVTIWFPDRVAIGRNVSINEWVFIDGYGGIDIGDGCRIAHGCSLISEDHEFNSRDIPIYMQGKTPGRIVLEGDVWLGAGVRVLKGVTLGHGAVVGAGAVVTRDIPPFSIAHGIPARVVGIRGGDDKNERPNALQPLATTNEGV